MKNGKWNIKGGTASNLFVVFAGILFYVLLSHFAQIREVLASWLKIISPFIWGVAIAYLLDGPVRFFQKKFHIRRGLSITFVYILVFFFLCFLIGMVLPQVLDSLRSLSTQVNKLPEYLEKIAKTWKIDNNMIQELLMLYQSMLQKVGMFLTALLPKILDYGVAIGSGLISAITALISSIYMLMSKERLLRQMRIVTWALLSPSKAKSVCDVATYANKVFGGFINGKIIDSIIIGLICFVCMLLLNIPFSILISVIVGVTNIIPFFGPFIGAVPSILILLIVDPVKALTFAIFVLVLQQFDGNILGPKILGDSTGLSALWVLVAIIVCGGLFGFVGMVMGVPFFAVLYALAREFFMKRLEQKGIDENGNKLSEEVNFAQEK